MMSCSKLLYIKSYYMILLHIVWFLWFFSCLWNSWHPIYGSWCKLPLPSPIKDFNYNSPKKFLKETYKKTYQSTLNGLIFVFYALNRQIRDMAYWNPPPLPPYYSILLLFINWKSRENVYPFLKYSFSCIFSALLFKTEINLFRQ